jgi:hypothetical protein
VTTPAAQTAADQMGQELPGLQGTTSVLLGHGTTLASPTNWEGPKAQLFRTQVWPDVEAALTKIHQDLTGLAESVAEINRRTAEAGS